MTLTVRRSPSSSRRSRTRPSSSGRAADGGDSGRRRRPADHRAERLRRRRSPTPEATATDRAERDARPPRRPRPTTVAPPPARRRRANRPRAEPPAERARQRAARDSHAVTHAQRDAAPELRRDRRRASWSSARAAAYSPEWHLVRVHRAPGGRLGRPGHLRLARRRRAGPAGDDRPRQRLRLVGRQPAARQPIAPGSTRRRVDGPATVVLPSIRPSGDGDRRSPAPAWRPVVDPTGHWAVAWDGHRQASIRTTAPPIVPATGVAGPPRRLTASGSGPDLAEATPDGGRRRWRRRRLRRPLGRDRHVARGLDRRRRPTVDRPAQPAPRRPGDRQLSTARTARRRTCRRCPASRSPTAGWPGRRRRARAARAAGSRSWPGPTRRRQPSRAVPAEDVVVIH